MGKGRQTPLGLDSKKDPHPSTCDLEKHEDENASFGFGEPEEPWHESRKPCETNTQVYQDGHVVLSVGEAAMAT